MIRVVEPIVRRILLRTIVRITIVILLFAAIGQFEAWQASQAAPVLPITFTFTCPGGAPIGTCNA
jgi:hypothetical protein